MSFLTTLLYCLLFMSENTKAFKNTGHFITGIIAKKIIKVVNPDVYDKIINVLASHPDEFQTNENLYPFVECTAWADYMKEVLGKKEMEFWHFSSNYNDGTRKLTPQEINEKNLPVATREIDWAIYTMLNSLVKSLPFQSEFTTDDIKIYPPYISLRMLMHLIGDIHQPLHANTLVNNTYPEGDSGGNKFNVMVEKEEFRLHRFWDTGLDYYKIVNNTLDEKEYNLINYFATQIIENNPRDENLIDVLDPLIWEEESFQLALKFAHVGVAEKQQVSPEYKTEGIKIIDQRLALAGYRMAKMLLWIYNPNNATNLKIYNEDGTAMEERLLI